MFAGPFRLGFLMKEMMMSETMTAKAHEYKEKKLKDKEPKGNHQKDDPDPYCCTPGDGGGGPDTKP